MSAGAVLICLGALSLFGGAWLELMRKGQRFAPPMAVLGVGLMIVGAFLPSN